MTALPRGRPLTAADLDTMPDDGHRYELIDGTLVVTPSPSLRHQLVSGRLYSVLGCPAYWVVDPDSLELTAWELRDATYAEVARVSGHEPYAATAPFEVAVVPSKLVR